MKRKMFEDLIHHAQQLPDSGERSVPSSAHLLEYYNSEILIPETIPSSEITSSCPNPNRNDSNYYEDSSCLTDPSLSTSNLEAQCLGKNDENLLLVLDSHEDVDDISASIDFSTNSPFHVPSSSFPSSNREEQFEFSALSQSQALANNDTNGFIPYLSSDPIGALLDPTLASILEDCMSSPASSCTILSPGKAECIPVANMNIGLYPDASSIFTSGVGLSSELQRHELDYQEYNNGFFCSDPNPQTINPDDVQALIVENQKLLDGHVTSTTPSNEISLFEDPAFRVGKLSNEERKEKIHRYMKKRNERNFTKKIKYACRKTLADSRPRVRGRFAKNDNFMESQRASSTGHDEDDDDEELQQVMVKEEEIVDSSNIFAQISGENSFKCSYPIQPWI